MFAKVDVISRKKILALPNLAIGQGKRPALIRLGAFFFSHLDFSIWVCAFLGSNKLVSSNSC